MKRYLVTGGLGFLGAPTVRMLLERGHRVRILDDLSRGAMRRLEGIEEDVEIVNGDIRDWDVVAKAMTGVDAVLHFAFVNGTQYFYEKPAYVLDVGIKGITNVLDACVKNGVEELIVASSSEVYQTPPSFPTSESVPLSVPDPLNPRYSYGGGKIITELMAINYGRRYLKRVLVFRPHNVFGPDMGWEHVIPAFVTRLVALSRENPKEVIFPIQGNGQQSRSFIYIDDFVEGIRCILDKGDHLNIYNVGTQNEVTIADLAQATARCLDLDIQVAPGPDAPGGTLRRCPSVMKLAALGFRPRCDWKDSLRITVDWYRDHPAPVVGRTRTDDQIFLR